MVLDRGEKGRCRVLVIVVIFDAMTGNNFFMKIKS